MSKLAELLLGQFRRPTHFIVCLLGALILVLSLIGGPLRIGALVLPRIETAFRIAAGVLGLALLLLALFVDRQPAASPQAPLPVDLTRPFSERRARLSDTQERLLRYIIQQTRRPGTRVSESEVSAYLRRPGDKCYYRLEQLRLLGFLRKDSAAGIGHNTYWVDAAYAKEIKHEGLEPEPTAV